MIQNLRWLLLSIHLWATQIAFSITIQITIKYFPAQSTVLNRQHKWVINLIFPLIQISPSLVELFWSPLHSIIFYFVGKTPHDMQWRKRKTKLPRTWKGKFIYLSFRIASLFGFWENVLFPSYMACDYCVICSCRKAFK